MKSLLAMLATVLLLNVAGIDDAQAKRLGGGKSFGKSFSTSPYQRKQAPAGNAAQQTNQSSSKRGLLGGLFGGLLAGGLLAALFAGGAFEGIQFMDILIFALIGFILFKIFRSMSRAKASAQAQAQGAAYAGHGGFGQPGAPQQPAPGFGTGSMGGGSDVPFNLPPGFDLDAFLNGARDHYRGLQDAWNHGDMDKLREYFSPEMFAELNAERASLETDPQTEVMFVDVELGRADYNQALAQVSLRFSGRTRDAGEGIEEDITDIWHLERDLTQPNAPWMIVGIEN